MLHENAYLVNCIFPLSSLVFISLGELQLILCILPNFLCTENEVMIMMTVMLQNYFCAFYIKTVNIDV